MWHSPTCSTQYIHVRMYVAHVVCWTYWWWQHSLHTVCNMYIPMYIHIISQWVCTPSLHSLHSPSGTQLPYFLDQTPPSNSRRTQIVAASFPYLSFTVAALKLPPHILTIAHLQKKKVEEERSREDTQQEKVTGRRRKESSFTQDGRRYLSPPSSNHR